MAYQTGSATSLADLLTQLATLATANGWTEDYLGTYSGFGTCLSLHNSAGAYFNFAQSTDDKQLSVWGATGYSGSAGPNAQPGTHPNAVIMRNNDTPGPFLGYYFFVSSTYIHVVIELSAGVFMTFMVGQPTMAGALTDVMYVQASYWYNSSIGYGSYPEQTGFNCIPFSQNASYSSYVGCTIDSSFKWMNSYGSSQPNRPLSPLLPYGYCDLLMKASPNTFNGVAALVRLPLFMERATGNIWSHVGTVADARAINVTNIDPKTEITLGSDVWKVFPVNTKGAVTNVYGAPPNSGIYGFAFKK